MTHQITQDQEERLVQAALAGLSRSYAPYSHFHVSAALLCGDGTIYTGNNIENAAYSATVCAERCAFFRRWARESGILRLSLSAAGGMARRRISVRPAGSAAR